jgi:hypothetical protein
MPLTKITSFPTDIPKLNQELARLDQVYQDVQVIKQQLLGNQINNIMQQQQDQPVTTNNLVFEWLPTSTTVTWQPGYIQNKLGANTPVAGGSMVLSPNTVYWIYWNPIHQQMLFDDGSNGNVLATNTNNYVVCQVVTGDNTGLNAVIGGGGIENPGYGTSDARYDEFS